jgi:hypothetical protein
LFYLFVLTIGVILYSISRARTQDVRKENPSFLVILSNWLNTGVWFFWGCWISSSLYVGLSLTYGWALASFFCVCSRQLVEFILKSNHDTSELK